MNKDQEITHMANKPINLGRRRLSLQTMRKQPHIQIVAIHRASSIHHLRKCDKPSIKQNHTYVETKTARNK